MCRAAAALLKALKPWIEHHGHDRVVLCHLQGGPHQLDIIGAAVPGTKVAKYAQGLPEAHLLAMQGTLGWVFALAEFGSPCQRQQVRPQLLANRPCNDDTPGS